MFALADMDEDEDVEPNCIDCGAGLYTELHEPTCPRASEDLEDLDAEELDAEHQ